MNTDQLEHLKRIDAHIDKLLEQASKRTPGEWETFQRDSEIGTNYCRVTFTDRASDSLHGYCGENNAAFIASCAGNAEAGWKATKAAIALCIANLHSDPEFQSHETGEICDNDGRGCRACGYTESILLESILAAWPLELLETKP